VKPAETKTPATFWLQALRVVKTTGLEPAYFALDDVACGAFVPKGELFDGVAV